MENYIKCDVDSVMFRIQVKNKNKIKIGPQEVTNENDNKYFIVMSTL